MKVKESKRLAGLSEYTFAEIRKKAAALKEEGVEVIDFTVGDPTEPTPGIVRSAIKEAVDRHAASGYPSYIGSENFREAVAGWMSRRFGVRLDPENEICATIGCKEAVFNFPEAFVNPGNVVITPNPGYPPYARGALFAEAEVYYLNILPEDKFLPDLSSIPKDILKRAKLLWLNYPHNPTGAVATLDYYKRAVEFGREHGVIVASDEAYSENYYGQPPPSVLQAGLEDVVAFNSLSKRSRMTGYRVGWIAGDRDIVAAFKKLKTNIDSGTPTFIQDAAVAALSDEAHVDEFRTLYNKKRGMIADAFTATGLPDCRPAGTIHFWQRTPDGADSMAFTEQLMDPRIGILATPGELLSETIRGINPGENHVRLSLVPSLEKCELAAERIRQHL